MNGMCKCFHSWSASACPVARVILTALLALLPAAGCEKKAADTPQPQAAEAQPQATEAEPEATEAKPEATPAPAIVPPDSQPEKDAQKTSRVADKKDLPSPQQIFDRHIEMTGGREAYEKLRNVLTQSTTTATRSGRARTHSARRKVRSGEGVAL